MNANTPQGLPLSEAKRALLERWQRGSLDLRQDTIVPTPFATFAPTSIQQEIVARLHTEWPGSPGFTIAHAAVVGTALDPGVITEACIRLAERHESLRTTFDIGVDEVRQRIGGRVTFEVETIDLRSRTADTSLDVAVKVCRDLAVQPMDIVNGPLGRVGVVRVGRDLSVLLLAVDHLIADGFSLGIALLGASELYDAIRMGRGATFPPLKVQYRDYAVWQRRWLASEAWRPQADYWRGQLHGLPAAELPVDHADGNRSSYRAGSLWFRFPPSLSQRVRDVARTEGVTPFHVLFGAYCLLHRVLSDQEQVGIGTAFLNRLYPEVEQLVGYFTNTVVLRVDMAGRPTGRELLQRLKETTTAAWKHQEILLDHYLAEVEPERNLRVDPLYRTFFVIQPPVQTQTFAGADMSSLDVETGVTSFDLALYLWDEPTYRGKLEWIDTLFEPDTIEKFRTTFFRLLDALVYRCAAPIDDAIAVSRL